ncbi:kinase-like domain-containing protein [Leptodontidium sp. 2 PMI_412]|nr:kinase-like domain-containing protein [Leptodontidium sp. 2 PMI_412]
MDDDRFRDVAKDPDVRQAIDLIYTLPVSPPEHRMLVSFIRESVNVKATALYVLTRASSNGKEAQDVEAQLRSILKDWKELVRRFASNDKCSRPVSPDLIARDKGRCCATGRTRVWWDMFGWSRPDPVQIVPESLYDVNGSKAYLHELLSIFLTQEKLQQLTTELNGEKFELRNTWTLSREVAVAFKSGQLLFEPGWNAARRPNEDMKPTCRGRFIKLSTPDASALPLPGAFFFGIHSRMSISLRSMQIHQQMSTSRYHRPIFKVARKFLMMPFTLLTPSLQKLWLFIPQVARISVYKCLLRIGLKLYGSQLPWVQRMPFGLYMKHGRGKLVPQGEASALRLVEGHTNIPAPRLIDSITRDNHTYLVMTRVPGVPLSQAIPFMSYPERKQLAMDLRAYVLEFQKIPNTNGALICDSDGGPVFDYRIPKRSAGPFDSEKDFNDYLITQESLRGPTHSTSHKITFTHADLNLTNILVDGNRLSGLVDFGCAGFYPEYWEFTKAKFSEFGPDPAWTNLVTVVFGDTYLEEFEAEQKLWAVNSTL